MGPMLRNCLRNFMCVLGRDSFSSGILRLLAKCINLRQLTISTKRINFSELCESGAFDDIHGFSQLRIENNTKDKLDFAQLFKQIGSLCAVNCISHAGDTRYDSQPRRVILIVH